MIFVKWFKHTLNTKLFMLILKHLILIFYLLVSQIVYAQKDAIETTGDVFLVSIPVAALSTTLIKKDWQGTWQFTKSMLLNQVVTFGLKKGINKDRPGNNGDNAFPSGHTSTTFQGASFIHKRYGFKYSIPAYLAAGYTAFSRIDANKHDGWDILAGTIIGIGSSYLFATPYQKKYMEVTFSSYDKNCLLGFKYRF